MAQLVLELVADFLVSARLAARPAETKRIGKGLLHFALTAKTGKTTLLVGRCAVHYLTYAEAARRTWRERARALEEDNAGISALRWRLYFEAAQEELNQVRAVMTGEQVRLHRARELLARVPELTALGQGVTIIDQVRECVELALSRGRVMERYEAIHLEAAAEFVELGQSSEDEEEEEAAEVDSDEGL
jgi:hypothetical protein